MGRRYGAPVVLQRPVETRNALNEAVISWETYRSCWATLTEREGSEGDLGPGITAATTVDAEIRRAPSGVQPQPRHRLKVGTTAAVLEIASVVGANGINRNYTLQCREVKL